MKNNTFRLVIWIILFIIFAVLGGLGLYRNIKSNAITNDEKNTLVNVSNIYNDTNYVNLLKDKNIITNAKVKGNKIIITYSDQIIDTKYTYEYNNNELKINLDNNDENGWLTTKILIDSVSVLKGNPESGTYDIFDNVKINKISDDPAININTDKDKTEITFSTINSVTITKLNLEDILNDNIDKIKSFDYTFEDNNLNLILSATDTNQIIEIKQKEELNENSYNLLINIISIIYNEDEVNEFKTNYPALSNEIKIEFKNFTITNEKDENYYILKTSIKK